MQLSDMEQEVKNIIQDSSLDDSVIGYINEAFLQASGRINIPDLKRVAVITTTADQMFTSLSGVEQGFSGRLSKLTNNNLIRFHTIEDMVDHITNASKELDAAGPVEYVALEGKTLWYYPTPLVPETIQCILFSNPALLEAETDTPDAFPEICHRNIGIHGAAFLAYTIIEDGIEGDKVNTAHHYTMFEKGITQLLEWIGRHRVHHISSCLNDSSIATTDWNSTFSRWRYAR